MNSALSNNTRLKRVVVHHSLLSTSVGFATQLLSTQLPMEWVLGQ